MYKKWGSRETASFFLLVPICGNGKDMAHENEELVVRKVIVSSRLLKIKSRKAELL